MVENKIAGGVVLYHPDDKVLTNISTYANRVDLLIAIDNSETPDILFQKDLHRFFPQVIYLFLYKNAGIAAALNIACKIALQHKCNWLLTMDQDSSFRDDHLCQMIKQIPKVLSRFQKVGIISPYHILHAGDEVKVTEQYVVRNIVMTSGNLLNLSAYAVTGPFEEKLFMDMVDYEYCLRLRKNKYLIIQDNHVHLKHSLGDFKIKKIFSKNIGVSNHNSLRRYYMTRNSLYVAFKHFKQDKVFLFNALKNLFIDPLIIVFFEKDKLAKLKSMYKGVLHFVFNRYGKAV